MEQDTPVTLEQTPENYRFVKQSLSMPLDGFVDYYGHRLPQCALIDEMVSSDEETWEEDSDSDSKDTLCVGEYSVTIKL